MIEVSLNSVVVLTLNHTMKIKGILGGHDVNMLIDYGVTHNINTGRVVRELSLSVSDNGSFGVQGLQVLGDFPLELEGTDVMLEIQWLQTIGVEKKIQPKAFFCPAHR